MTSILLGPPWLLGHQQPLVQYPNESGIHHLTTAVFNTFPGSYVSNCKSINYLYSDPASVVVPHWITCISIHVLPHYPKSPSPCSNDYLIECGIDAPMIICFNQLHGWKNIDVDTIV